MAANSEANSFALLDDEESDDLSNLLERVAVKANYSSMPSTAMTVTEKKKLQKIEKAEKKRPKQKKINKAESRNDVRTDNGRGRGCEGPILAKSCAKGKDGKLTENRQHDNEKGVKDHITNEKWNLYGKGQKLNETSKSGNGNKNHTTNVGGSYNNRRIVDKRHRAKFPGQGIVLGGGSGVAVVKDTGDDQPKSNGQEADSDKSWIEIVKSDENQRKSGIVVVEGTGDDQSNGQEVFSEENWTEIKSNKNQRKSSKQNWNLYGKAVAKGTGDDQSNGVEACSDEEWTEINLSHRNLRKYEYRTEQEADFDKMWTKIIESKIIESRVNQRKSSDGNWDLYGRGRRLNEEAGYANGNHDNWELYGRGRRLKD